MRARSAAGVLGILVVLASPLGAEDDPYAVVHTHLKTRSLNEATRAYHAISPSPWTHHRYEAAVALAHAWTSVATNAHRQVLRAEELRNTCFEHLHAATEKREATEARLREVEAGRRRAWGWRAWWRSSNPRGPPPPEDPDLEPYDRRLEACRRKLQSRLAAERRWHDHLLDVYALIRRCEGRWLDMLERAAQFYREIIDRQPPEDRSRDLLRFRLAWDIEYDIQRLGAKLRR